MVLATTTPTNSTFRQLLLLRPFHRSSTKRILQELRQVLYRRHIYPQQPFQHQFSPALRLPIYQTTSHLTTFFYRPWQGTNHIITINNKDSSNNPICPSLTSHYIQRPWSSQLILPSSPQPNPPTRGFLRISIRSPSKPFLLPRTT